MTIDTNLMRFWLAKCSCSPQQTRRSGGNCFTCCSLPTRAPSACTRASTRTTRTPSPGHGSPGRTPCSPKLSATSLKTAWMACNPNAPLQIAYYLCQHPKGGIWATDYFLFSQLYFSSCNLFRHVIFGTQLKDGGRRMELLLFSAVFTQVRNSRKKYVDYPL